METTKDNLQNLIQKINWEGGLIEYVTGYGGVMPDELKEQTKLVISAVDQLGIDLEKLCNEHDVGEVEEV